MALSDLSEAKKKAMYGYWEELKKNGKSIRQISRAIKKRFNIIIHV